MFGRSSDTSGWEWAARVLVFVVLMGAMWQGACAARDLESALADARDTSY